MDRRTLLFVIISVLIIVLYQELVLKQLVPPPEPQARQDDLRNFEEDGPTRRTGRDSAAVDPAVAAGVEELAEQRALPPIDGRKIPVATDLYHAVFDTAGGRLESLTLNRYRETNAPESPPLPLVKPLPDVERPLGLELRGARVWSDERVSYASDRETLTLHGTETAQLVLRGELDGKPVIKTFSFRGDAYAIELTVDVPPTDDLPAELAADGPGGQVPSAALVLARRVPRETSYTSFEGATALVDGDLQHYSLGDLAKPELLAPKVAWAGFEDHYFLTVAAPERADAVQLRPRGEAIEARILTPLATGSAENRLSYTLYFGPKEKEALEAAGHQLVRALNLGWFEPISLLLLQVLSFSHRFTGNYGFDIILLTVLVKIIFWPLTRKSFESMRAMQKVQPEMQRLREKFKDDPKQLNTEMMELYRRHKVNPLGGCLPMLLQIPVFIGLYNALLYSIELRHAPFVLWIHDLAAPERLQVLGYGIPVLTLLLGASMFVQQKMAPPAGDPTQQRIMMFMPLVFTFMFIGFPAGLTIYWLTNNVLTIAQQYFMLRAAAAPSGP